MRTKKPKFKRADVCCNNLTQSMFPCGKGHKMIFLNGLLMKEGIGNDYVQLNKSIIFNFPIHKGDVVTFINF